MAERTASSCAGLQRVDHLLGRVCPLFGRRATESHERQCSAGGRSDTRAKAAAAEEADGVQICALSRSLPVVHSIGVEQHESRRPVLCPADHGRLFRSILKLQLDVEPGLEPHSPCRCFTACGRRPAGSRLVPARVSCIRLTCRVAQDCHRVHRLLKGNAAFVAFHPHHPRAKRPVWRKGDLEELSGRDRNGKGQPHPHVGKVATLAETLMDSVPDADDSG